MLERAYHQHVWFGAGGTDGIGDTDTTCYTICQNVSNIHLTSLFPMLYKTADRRYLCNNQKSINFVTGSSFSNSIFFLSSALGLHRHPMPICAAPV